MSRFSLKMIIPFLQDIPTLLRPKYARITPHLVYAGECIDPTEKNVSIDYRYVDPTFYQTPFIIDFSELLRTFTYGSVDVEAINSYTVGQYLKKDGRWFSHFYEPSSAIKEGWFGAYIIFDDAKRKGREYMLHNPLGKVDDLDNINHLSMAQLVEVDQRCVFFSSHDGDTSYSMENLKEEFFFTSCSDSILGKEKNRLGEEWKTLSGDYETLSMLTDQNKTSMGLLSSVRSYCGLPSQDIYATLDPWHPTIIEGKAYARYFKSDKKSFWAVVYCCGTKFLGRDGTLYQASKTTSQKEIYQKMFDSLVIKPS